MNTDKRKSLMNVQPEGSMTPTDASYYYSSVPNVERIELRRVWDAICRRWPLMLITVIIVLVIGAVYTLKQKRVYEASALMLLASPRTTSFANDDTGILSDLASLTRSRNVQSELDILMSPDVFEEAAEQLGNEALIKGFGYAGLPQWAISLDTKKESDVITVKAKAYDPQVAADLANRIISAGIDREQGFSINAASQSKDNVAIELDRVRKRLIKAKDELAQYKRKTKLLAAESQFSTIAGNMLNLQMEKDKYNIERAARSKQIDALENQLVKNGNKIESSQTIQTNPEYLTAQSALGQLQAQRAQLLQKYTPEAREIMNIDGAIEETQKRMETIARNVVGVTVQSRNPFIDNYIQAIVDEASANARVAALDQVLGQRDKQIAALPEQERNMTLLMQNVDSLNRNYQMLGDKYNTLSINERSTIPGARLASTARPIYKPVSPNRRRNAGLFLLLGLMISVAVAAVAERLDKRLYDEETVAHLTGEMALAVIPDEKSLLKLGAGGINHNTPFVEAFRILRNVTLFSDEHSEIKLLAVTSPGSSEGKTTTCVNLARSLAMMDMKVLLVECDLRKPSLHSCLDISNTVGFTNVVKGLISAKEAIQPTIIDNVFCLPSGPLPEDPAEFLNLIESRETLRILSDEYDAVILDCPPCAGLSDVQVISTIVEGVLLVVTMKQTIQPSLERAIRSLEQVGAPVIGYVINRLNVKRSGYDYYQYNNETQPKTKRWRWKVLR